MDTSPTPHAATPISSALRAVPHKVPVLFAAMGLVAIAYVVLPVIAVASRVPWGDFASIAAAPSTLELLKTTVSAAAWSTALATLLGTALA